MPANDRELRVQRHAAHAACLVVVDDPALSMSVQAHAEAFASVERSADADYGLSCA
jgi:hypothetical protein